VTEPPTRIDIIRRAQQIIGGRGWSMKMSTDNSSPLNLRSAISRACTELVGTAPRPQWYELYLDAVHAIGAHLQHGLTDWEFKVKKTSEVEAMLTEVINRLENGDIKPRASRSARYTGL
jgi:hypothetical protein